MWILDCRANVCQPFHRVLQNAKHYFHNVLVGEAVVAMFSAPLAEDQTLSAKDAQQ
jgi:hypothetical protein